MFCGSLAAIVTPFTKEDRIDIKALEDLVRWHVESGTDGLVCCGTTGEAPTLSDGEKMQVFEVCIRAAAGKCKIIAGTGSNDTKKSQQLTERARKLGADGALVVVPYYNKPTQLGVVAHFAKIATAGLPIIVYHHPGRCGLALHIETFLALSALNSVVAIKEASGDLTFIERLMKFSPLPILSGDDALTIPIIKRGGVGVISVVANIIPREWKQMVDLSRRGDFSGAQKVFLKYESLVKVLFLETNPIGIKYALELMGKIHGGLRLPLVESSPAVKRTIAQNLQM